MTEKPVCVSSECWKRPTVPSSGEENWYACERILLNCAGRETGKGCPALQVHQLVRMRNRRRNEDRSLCRNSEKRQGRPALQGLQPYIRLRRRGHRGQCFYRPRRDLY